ncbi:MAG: hypothetical protein H7325_05630, partial [Pedobacter sp.]|nr:hypothetical protein [Pedobacter sp.]
KEITPLKFAFKTKIFDFDGDDEVKQVFRWENIEKMNVDELTFKTDKTVGGLLKAHIKNLDHKK